MKYFKWYLSWSLNNINVIDNDVIPVYYVGRIIGNVTISLINNHIIGSFELEGELNENDYILYMISLPDSDSDLSSLTGISIVPKEQLGNKNITKSVKEMTIV